MKMRASKMIARTSSLMLSALIAVGGATIAQAAPTGDSRPLSSKSEKVSTDLMEEFAKAGPD